MTSTQTQSKLLIVQNILPAVPILHYDWSRSAILPTCPSRPRSDFRKCSDSWALTILKDVSACIQNCNQKPFSLSSHSLDFFHFLLMNKFLHCRDLHYVPRVKIQWTKLLAAVSTRKVKQSCGNQWSKSNQKPSKWPFTVKIKHIIVISYDKTQRFETKNFLCLEVMDELKASKKRIRYGKTWRMMTYHCITHLFPHILHFFVNLLTYFLLLSLQLQQFARDNVLFDLHLTSESNVFVAIAHDIGHPRLTSHPCNAQRHKE